MRMSIHDLMRRRRVMNTAMWMALERPTHRVPTKMLRRLKRAKKMYWRGSALDNRFLEIAEASLREAGFLQIADRKEVVKEVREADALRKVLNQMASRPGP